MAVLQRMLITAPWRAFDLKVTFFSEAARRWWEEELADNARMRTTKTGRLRKDPLHLRVTGQDLKDVSVAVRTEGVDGERLLREQPVSAAVQQAQGIGPIQVDDGQLAGTVAAS
jgi:hypothetical protein